SELTQNEPSETRALQLDEDERKGLAAELRKFADRQEGDLAKNSPHRDLADELEKSGVLDLNDADARQQVQDVIQAAGWNLDSSESTPPPEIRRVVDAASSDPDRAEKLTPTHKTSA